MKLLIPLLKSLSIDSGIGVIGPREYASLRLLITLWSNGGKVASTSIECQAGQPQQIFLNQIFSHDVLAESGMATAEFTDELGHPQRVRHIELQLLLKSTDGLNLSSILFDMVPDKRAGHKYSPILHCAHCAYSNGNIETYAVLVNFRPTRLPTQVTHQMHIQSRSPEGETLRQRVEELKFNDTAIFPYEMEFGHADEFLKGGQLNFRGGESQFAIFTLFRNRKSGAIGIEHSLPPIYYCSDIYFPRNREMFFKNAFKNTLQALK